MSDLLIKNYAFDDRDVGLLKAAIHLFSGYKDALLYCYQYGSPHFIGDQVRGAQLWDQFVHNNKDYYLYGEETEILKKFAHDIKKHASGEYVLVDLGPGSKDAIVNKSANLIRSIQTKRYMPIDICPEFVALAEKQIKFLFPYIPTSGVCKNFFELDHLTSLDTPVFMNFLGGSIANIPLSSKEGYPKLALLARLKKLTRFLPKGSRFLISQDSCQDPDKIKLSYGGSEKAEFSKNVLFRIKRDLNTSGFKPELFRYEPIWHPEKYLLAHTLISTESQNFTIEDEEFSVTEGQGFIVSHSYKYPEKEFLSVLNEVGLENLASYKTNDNGVVIHLAAV